jgi:crotonobetainyl-CoA:carnitine CoA-transferase CaiB-like acyl-CoA transferase
VEIDLRAAAATLAAHQYEMIGGQPLSPPERNPLIGMYECRDGRWIYIHGEFPHLAQGTLSLLGCEDVSDASLADSIQRWDSFDLEEAMAQRLLCGAVARTADEWLATDQGSLFSSAPAVEVTRIGDAPPEDLRREGRLALSGVRVLEFARILAGPMCGRTLAEHGADVLNVSAPHLPDVEVSWPVTSHGKRSCSADLRSSADADRMGVLAGQADVVIDSFRSGALQQLGYGPYRMAERRPGVVYVSINCYGHDGPWRTRGGWDPQAQMVTGLAVGQGGDGRPQRLPSDRPAGGTAPADYLTGFLAAYGAMVGLARRVTEGGSWWVRASLCQSASWIVGEQFAEMPRHPSGFEPDRYLRQTHAGDRFLGPVAVIDGKLPTLQLARAVRGGDEAAWAE